jgi:hypothetical protein
MYPTRRTVPKQMNRVNRAYVEQLGQYLANIGATDRDRDTPYVQAAEENPDTLHGRVVHQHGPAISETPFSDHRPT